jgi:flagellar biosynthesis component FlhA
MPQRAALKKFINIFRIELEELEQDINDMIEIVEQRRNSREITNYVYIANKGVLLNEISSVRELLDQLSTIDAYQYESVEALIEGVREMLEKRIEEYSFPDAVHHLVERRLNKVCTYVLGP